MAGLCDLPHKGAFTRTGLRSSKRPVLQPLTQREIPEQAGNDEIPDQVGNDKKEAGSDESASLDILVK